MNKKSKFTKSGLASKKKSFPRKASMNKHSLRKWATDCRHALMISAFLSLTSVASAAATPEAYVIKDAPFLAEETLAQKPNTQKGYRTESVEAVTVVYDTVLKTQRYPLSRVGLTVGPQFFMPDYYDNEYVPGFGAEVFFCQTAGRYFFLSVNTGFSISKEPFELTLSTSSYYTILQCEQTTINCPVFVGFHWFLTHNGIRPNIGIEAGVLFKSLKLAEGESGVSVTRNYICPILGLVLSMSIPVSKDFAVEVNFKTRTNTYFGINLGASYFLNW